MATTYKVLGQSTPAADTATVLYTVPAATEAIGAMFICNRHAKINAKINIAVTKSGGTLGNKDYLYFQRTLAPCETLKIEGFQLATGDFVNIKSSRADTSFNLIGSEIA